MRLSDFDYQLPRSLIAHYPLKERDGCRMLVVDRAAGSIEHASFRDFARFLDPGDLVVVNDTKVLSCRLKGRRATGGAVEAFLLRHRGGCRFDALLKPGRLKTGERVLFGGSVTGIVTGRNEIAFEAADAQSVYAAGTVPLPPYIKRDACASDGDDYQTMYAERPGAVAAPTAGLHFTPATFAALKARGVAHARLTLHVGAGTFKPVKTEDVREHAMDPETFYVPAETQRDVAAARARGRRVVAVGTTSVRALESCAAGTSEGETSMFILPGYRFRLVDAMLTNFHLPQSTLFMLVCAFGGTELMKRAYRDAIAERYRFYSYGDAMLIL